MRRLTPVRFAALLFCGFAAAPLPLAAQGRARVTNTETPQQEQRPQGEALHVPAVDPQLEQVLVDWYEHTKGIEKLQGVHRRWTYEATFQVAKVASGKFYYEAPDKGRIDVVPDEEKLFRDLDPATPGTQVKDDTGKVYTLNPDQPEKWVCDGAQVIKIDDAAETFEVLTIPPEHRGANIMDGPLPFLFGLPPDKAKQRYEMTLVTPPPNPDVVFLVVTPRMRQDAANWQRAYVMLDKRTYLPTAVKLLDPSGNRSTVFSFADLQVNKINLAELFPLFGGDPFKPVLAGYKQVQAQQPGPVQILTPEGKPAAGVPSVIGLSHTQAKTVLGNRGYRDVSILHGPVTKDPKLRWRVAEQSPQPNAAAPANTRVSLKLYIFEEDLAKKAAATAQQ